MRKKILLFSALILMILCISSGKIFSYKTTIDDNEKKELVLAASRYACPGADDAYYCSFALGVWEGLIRDTSDGYKGWLAESYSHNNDYTEWNFKLRNNVFFHDGEKFNADAVIFNFKRMEKKLSSGYVPLYIEKSLPNLLKIEKVDDYNLRFIFRKPVPHLLKYLSGYGSPMFSPKCINKSGYFSTVAQGTGPYKIAQEYPEQFVCVTRNNEYWGDKSIIKNVKLKTIKDPTSRVLALEANEIMGVVDLGALDPAMAKELLKNDEFSIIENEGYTTNHYVAFNFNKAFKDRRLREAVSLAINRDVMVKNIFFGYAVPICNLIGNQYYYHKNYNCEYNIEKAVEYVRNVTGGNVLKAKLILRQKDCNRYPQEKMALYLQSCLKSIGINVDIQILETQYYSNVLNSDDWDLTISKCGADESVFKSILAKNGSMNKLYKINFNDTNISNKINEMDFEVDSYKVNEFYGDLQDIIHDNYLVVPCVRDIFIAAYNSKKIYGFTIDKYPNTTLSKTGWLQGGK